VTREPTIAIWFDCSACIEYPAIRVENLPEGDSNNIIFECFAKKERSTANPRELLTQCGNAFQTFRMAFGLSVFRPLSTKKESQEKAVAASFKFEVVSPTAQRTRNAGAYSMSFRVSSWEDVDTWSTPTHLAPRRLDRRHNVSSRSFGFLPPLPTFEPILGAKNLRPPCPI